MIDGYIMKQCQAHMSACIAREREREKTQPLPSPCFIPSVVYSAHIPPCNAIIGLLLGKNFVTLSPLKISNFIDQYVK